ncbi:hypothetical protein Pcinc_014682 [Petrolisthes cinctipes]|uniref:G-patch domain-containing protein n=1 Tax=Petrolisthes cinctipes TaxID=88211 RepID=A0AAE1BW62_PETCI|nr:hypothetical protein Pcinc_035722 [Petrolisthes cinctipes]KAK3880849.1 hypothetical protein Pcinc_014682 [Petrolisthes cinctipes]
MTKEQQIYGMWAKDSGGEEDEDTGPPIPAPTSRMRVLRGGLNFIPGGIQQAGKKQDKVKKDGSGGEDEDEEESELSARPMFRADSSDEEAAPTTTSRSRPASLRGKRAPSSLQSSTSKRQDIAGMRRGWPGGSGGSGLLGSGVGDWEKYTSGIGSKLLKKMGFEEGKGLGKNLQGIATPVEANKRKGKGAIGFYGAEHSSNKSKPPAPDSEEEEKEEYRELLQQWKKKSGSGGRKKIKYVYKSAEDVIEEGKKGLTGRGGMGHTGADDSHITRTKVIDMTGPETRVLSSYHALAGRNVPYPVEEPQTRTFGHLDLPELLHNLDLLLERCEEDILSNARSLERAGDRTVHLQHERARLHSLLERERVELTGLDGALAVVEELQSSHADRSLTLQAATEAFTCLKTDHSRVYHTFQLAHLAPTLITPLLRTLLRTWEPLTNPTTYKDVFGTWQELVEECEDGQGMQQPELSQPLDPYHQLVWETWAVVVREAVTTSWQPRECAPLLTLLEAWPAPLVPEWIRAHLLQQVVLPRITETVNGWDPLQDTVAIHTWLHPWLPFLAEHLQTVYPVIRQKLGAALVHWHPSDRSARLVLEPWRRVFSGVSMTTLLQSSIVPKLETALLETNIAPPANPPEGWRWFMDWEDLLPQQVILEVLDRSFFPRWYQSLATWLSTSPPHTQAIAWYKGWQAALPRALANHLQLRQKFQQALEICSRALTFQPGAPEQFNLLLAGLDKISEPPPPPPLGSPPRQPQRAGPGTTKDWANIISSARRDTLSMREVVERRCQERGVVFLPLPDRTHQGRPVYRCGSRHVSFNKTIIYAHTERGWTPTSLDSLLDDA